MIHCKTKQYANGLTLITAPLRDTQTVTSFILVRVGSRYENEHNNGISHFLEHLFSREQKTPLLLKSRKIDGLGQVQRLHLEDQRALRTGRQ